MGIELKVADTVHDIELAARLLHDAYVARGIAPSHPSGVRVTPHFVLPSTVTLVAKRGDEIAGTLSILSDGPLGPPMAKIFVTETAALRRAGRRIAELGALALAPKHRKTGLTALLYRMAFDVSMSLLSVDDFVFAVHPDAEEIYESTFLSERIGPVLRYPGLNATALAVPIRVDLRRAPALMQRAFAGLPRDTTNPHHVYFEREFPQIRMPDAARFVERMRIPRLRAAATLLARCPDALADLDAATMAALQTALPHVDVYASHLGADHFDRQRRSSRKAIASG
jgi:hypothetical protein